MNALNIAKLILSFVDVSLSDSNLISYEIVETNIFETTELCSIKLAENYYRALDRHQCLEILINK
jgi:hypothetical protein